MSEENKEDSIDEEVLEEDQKEPTVLEEAPKVEELSVIHI